MNKLSVVIFIACILFSFASAPAFAEEATEIPDVIVTVDPAEAGDTAEALEAEEAVETAEVSETGEAVEASDEENMLGMEAEDSDEIEEAE